MGISQRPVVRVFAMLAVVILLTAAASAAQRPVKDDAGFFSASAVSQAEAQFQKLQQQYHRTVMVETFADLPAELQGKVDGNDASKKAAYESFVQARSYSLGADLYIMATKSPGHLETYARRGSRVGLTREGYQRLRTDLLAAFKAKQFDQGLTSLADSMLVTAQSGPAVEDHSSAPAGGASNVPQSRTQNPPVAVPAERSSSGLFGLGGCMTIVIVVGVVLIAVRLIRGLFGPRNPPPLPPGGYGGQPGSGYGQPGYGQQGGYGMGQGGGGFGRGLLGGVLGGLLGGYAGNQVFGQHHNDPSNTGGDPNAGAGGGDIGGNDDSSNDLGGGGGDFGGGSDFSSGGDSGGGGDF